MENQKNPTDLIASWRKALLPPPKLTVSQWADKHRKLSPEASAEPGQWDTSRAEFQRGIMDIVTDPDVHIVVVKKSSQIGWTEILNNIIGYFIDQDPCPMMSIQPTEQLAEAWSKDRLAPMIRDTACLREKVGDSKAKDSGNTILHKTFPGGHLTAIGANAPANLASRPIRIVLPDEVDRYPASAGVEGDPINLAKKRTKTFYNWKMFMGGTPTVDGISRTDLEFQKSDQRRYFVPCPECGEFDYIRWSQIQWPEGEPQNAYYVCAQCGSVISESHKHWMVKNGEWRATAHYTGVVGFHIWEAYSPWSSWGEIVCEFLKSKASPDTLKTFVNTTLGETWQEAGETVDDDALYNRREEYPAQVPMGALLLTAAVDVQANRLELEVKGWGIGEESWGIEYRVLYGDPKEDSVWKALDDALGQEFEHESGLKMRIWATFVDSGYAADRVYAYCKPRQMRRIFAVKGDDGPRPILGPAMKKRTGKNQRPVDLFIIGIDQAKSDIYSRLKKEEPGPGYYHFPSHYTKEFFKGLTAEKMITKFHKGFPRQEWTKKDGQANEPLDLNVYNYAALKLINPVWDALAARIPKVKGQAPSAPLPLQQHKGRRMGHEGIKL